MSTASKHARTEGRALVWGSGFTTKAAILQGDLAGFVPSYCVVGLGPVVARARVSVHDIARAEELAKLLLRVSASIMPLSRPICTARRT
jgi:hypothetical protein